MNWPLTVLPYFFENDNRFYALLNSWNEWKVVYLCCKETASVCRTWWRPTQRVCSRDSWCWTPFRTLPSTAWLSWRSVPSQERLTKSCLCHYWKGIKVIYIITARKRSCGKVMFLQVSVILSTGGREWLPGGVCGRGTCMVAGGACVVAWGGMRRIRRYTVNERAVRILLECILVLIVLLEMVKDKKDTVNFQFKALFTLNVCVYVFLWSLPSNANFMCEHHHLLP